MCSFLLQNLSLIDISLLCKYVNLEKLELQHNNIQGNIFSIFHLLSYMILCNTANMQIIIQLFLRYNVLTNDD